jgi:hypothetical protein
MRLLSRRGKDFQEGTVKRFKVFLFAAIVVIELTVVILLVAALWRTTQ